VRIGFGLARSDGLPGHRTTISLGAFLLSASLDGRLDARSAGRAILWPSPRSREMGLDTICA
jgi:hypothetical protein